MPFISSRLFRCVFVFALLSLTMVCACSSEDDTAADRFPGLEGRTFYSQQVQVDGVAKVLAPDTMLTLGFAEGGSGVGFRGGCNWMGGEGSLQNGILTLTGVRSTAMYCSGVMEQEDWYADFMASRPTVLAQGVTLTLVSGSTTIVYLDKEVATPDKKLTDGTWEVWQLCGSAVCHRGGDTVGTLRLETDGTASLFDFCRTGTATYKVSENEIAFADLAYESTGCSAKGAEYNQTGWNAVLQANVQLTFEIDASRLVLKGTEGEIRFNLAP